MSYYPYGSPYQNPYYGNVPMYYYSRNSTYSAYPNENIYENQFDFHHTSKGNNRMVLKIMDQTHLLLILMKQRNKTIRIVLLYGLENICKLH